MSTHFGTLLKEIRERADISMDKLAETSQTSASTISGVELGNRAPPPASVPLWAAALKLMGDELVRFRRSAQFTKAYFQKDARPELDALTDELAQARKAFIAIIPLLKAPKPARDRLHKVIVQYGFTGRELADTIQRLKK